MEIERVSVDRIKITETITTEREATEMELLRTHAALSRQLMECTAKQREVELMLAAIREPYSEKEI